MKWTLPLLLSLLVGCSSSKLVTKEPKSRLAKKDTPTFEIPDSGPSPENPPSGALQLFIADWEGVPHRMGGMSKKGVDCSGFTILLCKEVYGHQFASRRSEDLFGECQPLKRDELEEGDLVFFKIGSRRINHVGVYLGDGNFAHASSSKGVMISSLSEAYYDKYFFKGGRWMASQPVDLQASEPQEEGEEAR